METGKANLYACKPMRFTTLKGPRRFQSSFFDGHVVEMLEEFNQTKSPGLRTTGLYLAL